MNKIRFAAMLSIIAMGSAISAFGAEGTEATCSAPNAGYQLLYYQGMVVSVWYPTAATPGNFSYSNTISGSVALNAGVSTCAQYPLVIFSHGDGGCSTQSVFLTEELARHGYIVAAPNHADASCTVAGATSNTPTPQTSPGSFTDPSAWTNQTFFNRRTDIENTLNLMLNNPTFTPQIDATKIAMSGHSLGGYTTFAMTGGWSNWYDSRLGVALMFSPYVQAFGSQSPSTIPNVKVSQMYQGGTQDIGITPYLMRAGGAYDQSQIPKFFAELQGAGHFDFTNLVCGTTATTVQNCLTPGNALYQANAAYIDNYAISFLDRYVKSQSVSTLFGSGSGLATYKRNTPAASVSDASYVPAAPLAPQEIGAIFGEGLATSTATAQILPLPTILGGATVTIADSKGINRVAQLFYASGSQINYQIPDGTASGTATVTVNVGGNVVATGTIQVSVVAPSLFTANGLGTGLMNGFAQNGIGTITLPFDSNLAPNPIDVSGGNTYLILAATGVRLGSASATQASIGATSVPVNYVGPYLPFVGVDAISLGPLPASLAGSGMQTIAVSVNGVAANPVTVLLK